MDSIPIPRESLETFLKVANEVLENTTHCDDDSVSRVEVTMKAFHRKKLKQAIFETEKAIFRNDINPLTAEQMSANAQRRHEFEDFSENKMNHIEGRR